MSKSRGVPSWFIDQIQVGTKQEKAAQSQAAPVPATSLRTGWKASKAQLLEAVGGRR